MKTRSITEGAMLSAITVILTIIGEYVGLPALIIPVPLILLVFRHGYRLGITMSVASAVVASLIAGHVGSGVTIIIWGFLGIALGMALRENFSFFKTLLVGVAANLVVIGLNVFFYSLIFGANIFEDFLEMFSSALEDITSLYQSLGATSEMLAQMEAMRTTFTLLIDWGLPGLLLTSSVFMTFINLAVVRLILRRMGTNIPWVRPFAEWRLPGWLAILFLGSLILMGVGGTEGGLLPRIGLNLILILMPAYLIAGISLGWFYFDRWRIPVILRIIFLYLALFNGLVLYAVVLAAMVDSVYSLRRPVAEEK
ncbi:MAG: DUF2232 domain-containing protein [Firmicutes bacterium]|nr:DUF2232 domain-containing protein [Bacillota bacterium]